MPHFLHNSAGGETGCGDLGVGIRTQTLKRDHLHELLSTFSEMSALTGSLLHRIAALDKCMIHCCSLLCPLRIRSPDTLMQGDTPFISASLCVWVCVCVCKLDADMLLFLWVVWAVMKDGEGDVIVGMFGNDCLSLFLSPSIDSVNHSFPHSAHSTLQRADAHSLMAVFELARAVWTVSPLITRYV